VILVSLHLPKTAGTSFLALLEQAYGERLLRDYTDRPLNRPAWRRNSRALAVGLRNLFPTPRLRGVSCIHGHYLPLKYRGLSLRQDLRFVVWLRDPVERLASHYFYWQRSYNPLDAGRLHRRVIEERWDLERFCLGPELRNTYSCFLWGFPLAQFDFVGITEHYAADVRAFSARFLDGEYSQPAPRNVNAEHGQHGPESRYIADPDFRQRVEIYHAQDMALYRQALAMRQERSND